MFQSHDHHVKGNVCLTRPPYRDGKKLRAVKVYTIAQESKYLLVQNIPSIRNVTEQLLPYFNQYGKIEQHWRLDGYERKDTTDGNEFFDTILIKFLQIHRARMAKCRLDDMNFMGSNLHICYAPECESLDDLREKFQERRTIVQRRSSINQKNKKQRTFSSKKSSPLIPKDDTITTSESFEKTTNEIRNKIRDIVQKSNLIPLALQREIKKRKRLQI